MERVGKMQCLSFFAIILLVHVKAHTLGLHGLTGENPSGDPVLPEITGPFRLVFDVLFDEIDESTTFTSLFHWYGTGADSFEDSIYVGHRNRQASSNGARTELQIRRGDESTKCRAFQNLSPGVLYTFIVTLYGDKTATIDISGKPLVTCPHSGSPNDMFVPGSLARSHHLGKSPNDGIKNFQRLKGGISGLQLTNTNAAQHPRNTFKFWNFPGQSYHQGFVVSFYARFDKLSPRNRQTVFDFGNGSPSDNIVCRQLASGSAMECGVYDGSGTFRNVVTSSGEIDEGKFAFWHFGVDAADTSGNSRYWIQKNGEEVASVVKAFAPNKIFRHGGFVHSNWGSHSKLDGVVLGTRLDSVQVS